MKLTILNENACSHIIDGLTAEWGLSVYIEHQGSKVLFDVAYSGLYAENAKKLGLDLELVDYVVLSHNHDDHTHGLLFNQFKNKHKLLCHPDVLTKMPVEEVEKMRHDFEIITSVEPYYLSPDFIYLGQVPRVTSFETGTHVPYQKLLTNPEEGQEMLDDSALVIKGKEGAIVITGCSHSGIGNICEYAKLLTGQKLLAVIGGWHLRDRTPAEVVEATIDYLAKENIPYLYPMHCVDFEPMMKIAKRLAIKKISVGESLQID
jgi:7,8-dihydropterin-6-yl-methyl-4-(beta-D-ribofuranosyl)aminobenzene 5'-phosphate synthase